MLKLFQSFLAKMRAGFARIAKATKNEVAVEDLHSDAWILAHEIGKRRGKEIDFGDPDDLDSVMAALYARNVKRGDWKMRKAVRIDQEPDDDESAVNWANQLAANDSSDPLVALMLHESAMCAEAMLANSYSQAAAYVMVFARFKNNRQEVCAYLVISDGTLARRITFAADTVKVQPSLFDGIERINASFMPKPGRQYAPKIEKYHKTEQWAWNFEEEYFAA